MTNKLPVVGKRYKCIQRGLWWHKESLVCGVYQNKVWIDMCYGNNQDIISLEAFFRSHEELPEDKAETECSVGKKSNCKKCGREFLQHHRSDYYCSNYCRYMPKTETVRSVEMPTTGLSPKVKEAMEGLRKILIKENDSMFFTVNQSEYTAEVLRLSCHAFNDKAKILLNALDKQFGQKQEETEKKKQENTGCDIEDRASNVCCKAEYTKYA